MGLRAAILCTGTELTSGEIVNTNGAWLGEKLEDLGFQITTQVLVPDDRGLILDALDWIKPRVDLILISGGLGPTSDDLTREMVARWAGKELRFSDREWRAMQELHARRNLAIRPGHKHQCYFPAESKILPNPIGTALGFALDAHGVKLVVVPGPSRELHGMWDEHVEPVVMELNPRRETDLLVWTCMGVTESEAAEVSEEAIAGSGLAVGYRASIPYVRVKLWLPLKMQDRETWKNRLEEALKPWIVGRGQGDFLTQWLESIATVKKVVVRDGVSSGRLASRIAALGEKKTPWPSNLTVTTGLDGALVDVDALTFSLAGGSTPSSFLCELKYGGEVRAEELEIPYKVPVRSARGGMYVCEWALRWCLKTMPAILG